MPKFNVRRAVVSAGLAGALAFSGTAMAFAEEAPVTPNDGVQVADEAQSVTVNGYVGTKQVSGATVNSGTTFGAIYLSEPAPQDVPAGKLFAGWTLDPNTNEIISNDYKVTGNLSVYAVWADAETPAPELEYKDATFYDEDGVTILGTAGYPVGERMNSWAITPEAREGYTFMGYAKKGNATGGPVDPSDVIMTEGAEFIAVWEKNETPEIQWAKATFLNENGDIAQSADYEVGKALGFWAVTPADREGYTFKGYAIQGKEGVVVDPSQIIMPAEGMTFVPVWEKNVAPIEWATATFYDEDGKTVLGTADYQVDKALNSWNVKPAPRDGYTFTGYAIQGKESDGIVDPKTVAMSKDGMSFVAVWEKSAAPIEWASATFYDEDGKTVLGSADYQVNEPLNFWATTPAARDGYKFDGYAIKGKESDGPVNPAKVTMSKSGMEFVAVWSKVETPIEWAQATFLDEDGETVLGTADYQVNEAMNFWATTPAPREGYTFKGYAIQGKESDGVVDPAKVTMSVDGMTFVAVWEKDAAPIEWATATFYDEDGETVLGTADYQVNEALNFWAVTPADREGYEFEGYAIKGKESDGVVDPAKVTMSKSGMEFVATWKAETPAVEPVEVTFMDGAEKLACTLIYSKGETLDAFDRDDYAQGKLDVPAGYHFAYWADAEGNPFNGPLTADTTVYAIYEADETPAPIEWATATFYDMDGETVLGTADYQVNEPLNFWAVEPGPREGYTFDGYAIRWKATDGVVDPAQVTMSKDGMEFIAMWSKDEAPIEWAKATFLNEDGSLLGTADYQVNEALNVWAVEPAPREGYTFKGYAIQGKEDTIVDPAQVTMSADGMTFVAVWEKDAAPIEWAKATFLDTDGSVIGTADYQIGETMGFWAVIPGQREDAKFRGYEIQGKDGVVDPNDITMSKDGMTFVAVWEKVQTPAATEHKVTFDTDGGSAVESQMVEDGKTVTKPADPTKDGFKFDGWTLDGNPFDFAAVVKSDITLTAKWVKVGGTETPTDPEKPGDDANKPSDDNKKPGDKNDGKDEGKKDDSQKKDQLPKTGDDTNVAGLAAAGAAGVAALGAGAVLLNRRKREQN